MYIKMAKLSSKNQKKSLFYKEKSLVVLTPGREIGEQILANKDIFVGIEL